MSIQETESPKNYQEHNLPEWFTNKIPSFRECGTLGFDETKNMFWVTNDKDNEVEYYEQITQAIKKDCNLSIDATVKNKYKVRNNCVLVQESDNPQFIFVNNDVDKLDKLNAEWKTWQDKARSIQGPSASWQDAYIFIERFPLFWYPLNQIPTLVWSTRNGHDNVNHTIENDKIILTIMLDRTLLGEKELYIEVSDSSIDKAYIKLAQELINMVNIADCSCR